MVTTPTINPEPTSSSLLALLELVEGAEVAVDVDVAVTLVQLDVVPAGTVAFADKVKSAHCNGVCFSDHSYLRKGPVRIPGRGCRRLHQRLSE